MYDRRRELGLTQAELARRANVSRRTIIAFEGGESDIGLQRLMRMLLALDLTLHLRDGIGRPNESELRSLFKDDDE